MTLYAMISQMIFSIWIMHMYIYVRFACHDCQRGRRKQGVNDGKDGQMVQVTVGTMSTNGKNEGKGCSRRRNLN